MIQFYDHLTGYYYTSMKGVTSDFANVLFTSLFGVSDVTATDLSRDASDVFERYYFESSTCAAYVLARLEDLEDAFRGKYLFEAMETGIKPLTPGSSLYVILERQPVYFPFRWMWQCAVLGGANKFWLQAATSSPHTYPECDAFSAPKTDGNVQGPEENNRWMTSIRSYTRR
jgi:hypothetical protein